MKYTPEEIISALRRAEMSDLCQQAADLIEACRRDRDGYCWKCQAGPIDKCPNDAVPREGEQANQHDAGNGRPDDWRGGRD